MLPSPKCLELAGVAVKSAKAKELVISVAESCTGGMLAASITAIAGSSEVFSCGFVTYSAASKIKLLAVPTGLISESGSVSQAVAESMALGCLGVSGADLAVSITGVAGPDGGTAMSPVGTVYVGIAAASRFAEAVNEHSLLSRREQLPGVLVERYGIVSKGGSIVYSARLNITGDRAKIREQICYFALQELGNMV